MEIDKKLLKNLIDRHLYNLYITDLTYRINGNNIEYTFINCNLERKYGYVTIEIYTKAKRESSLNKLT